MPAEFLCLSFFFYSAAGWLYESTVCSIVNEQRFINRGFMLGPCCPIYGAGAVLCWTALQGIRNPAVLLVSAMMLCSTVEYCTSWLMEKLFHARWWDYSDLPFHFQGRICLIAASFFGVGNVAIRYLVQPGLFWAFCRIPPIYMRAAAVLLTLLFLADLTVTLVAWTNLNRKLDVLYHELMDKSNQSMESISNYLLEKSPMLVTRKNGELQICVKGRRLRFPKAELRFFRAFPGLRIARFEGLLQILRIRQLILQGYWPIRKNVMYGSMFFAVVQYALIRKMKSTVNSARYWVLSRQ